MSWVTGWKRQVDAFHLTLGYGDQIHASNLELLKNGQPLKSDIGSDLLSSCRFRVQLDWSAGDDEDQVALKLQSQIMVTLPAPHDEVQVSLAVAPPIYEDLENHVATDSDRLIQVRMEVHKRRELLRVVSLSRTVGSGPSADGLGVLTRVLVPASVEQLAKTSVSEELLGYSQNYRSISILNLSNCFLTVSLHNTFTSRLIFCNSQLFLEHVLYYFNLFLLWTLIFEVYYSCTIDSLSTEISKFSCISVQISICKIGVTQTWNTCHDCKHVAQDIVAVNLQTLPSELTKLPLLEKLYLDNNKITLLPPEVGQLTRLQVLQCDHNALVSVPGVLQCPLYSRFAVKFHP